MSKFLLFIVFGILGLSIALNVVTCRQKSKAKTELSETLSIIDIVQDSIQKFRDAEGRLIAKTRGLELSSWKMLQKVDTQDSLIEAMKEIISEEKRVRDISAITAETRVTKTLPTVIRLRDTTTVYITKFRDRWIDFQNVADADSSRFDLRVQNSFFTWSALGKRNGWFGRRNLDVFVRSENPYTDLSKVEKFTIKEPRQRRLGFGFYTGYGINSRGELGAQAGAGLILRIR